VIVESSRASVYLCISDTGSTFSGFKLVSGLWAQFGHICLLSMRLESFFAKGDSASLESAAEDRSDGRPAK
jgi:hypothetical protein